MHMYIWVQDRSKDGLLWLALKSLSKIKQFLFIFLEHDNLLFVGDDSLRYKMKSD